MQISISAVGLMQADVQSICWNDSAVCESSDQIQMLHSVEYIMILFFGKKHNTGIKWKLDINKEPNV